MLRDGIPIDFGERPESLSQEGWNERRTIDGQWLAELTDAQMVVRVPISLARAYIVSELKLSMVTFSFGVQIRECEITSDAIFTGCRFQGPLVISGSDFRQGINLDSAEVGGVFNADQAQIQVSASFRRTSFKDGFEVRRAHLEQANFAGTTFAKDAQFGSQMNGAGTKFLGLTKFNDAKFLSLADFRGTHFAGDAHFYRIVVLGEAIFRQYIQIPPTVGTPELKSEAVHFGGEAIFRYASLQGGADFRSAHFSGGADFTFVRISGMALFGASDSGPGVTFVGAARFMGMQVTGRLIFEGGEFKKEANFEALQVSGNALFRSSSQAGARMRFEGKLNLMDAAISGTVDFNGTIFEDDAVFVRMRVGGASFFRVLEHETPLRTEFRARADFNDASFGGMVTFEGAQFNTVNFRRAQFNGVTYFSMSVGKQPRVTTFEGDADFRNARFTASAYFSGVHFYRAADFSGTDFGRDLYLGGHPFSSGPDRSSGYFDGRTTFERARVVGSAAVSRVVFGKDSSANFSSLRVDVDLRLEEAHFAGGVAFDSAQIGRDFTVDLSGPGDGDATFRLNNASVKGALRVTKTSVEQGYRFQLETVSLSELDADAKAARELAKGCNIHTLLQFEKAYRSVGEETAADRIYLTRRSVERVRNRKKLVGQQSLIHDRLEALGALLTDFFPWMFRYGQPAFRLLIVAGLLFFAGVVLLSRKEALQPTVDPAAATRDAPTVKDPDMPWGDAAIQETECSGHSWGEPFWAMAAATVGGESIKRVSHCQPSTKPAPVLHWPYTVCTVVLGWLVLIFFSLFVAGYARLFKFKG
jgi:uncharacterized protein YjbI with pentapeptide repeats